LAATKETLHTKLPPSLPTTDASASAQKQSGRDKDLQILLPAGELYTHDRRAAAAAAANVAHRLKNSRPSASKASPLLAQWRCQKDLRRKRRCLAQHALRERAVLSQVVLSVNTLLAQSHACRSREL